MTQENSQAQSTPETTPVATKKEEQEIVTNPVTKSNTEYLQMRPSAKASEYALGLSQKLDQSRVNIERLQISVNGELVFGMKNGDIERDQTKITDKQADLIKQALNDPTSFDGSMKITQGGKTLLHIKDGKVLIDSVGLVNISAKVELKTPDLEAKQMYERYSKEVKPEGLAKTKETAINALQDGVSRDDVTKMLKSQDAAYQKLVSTSGEQLANKSLDKIVNNALSKVKLSENKQQQVQEKTQTQEKAALNQALM